ncbi:hypothetical protein JVT61DRAFT_6838 [Boletus reticuloceps]|uniref:Uncharacterized protein n=1 Tax=Boletus reticuloceps TaxID=495285 RepID=A0A8I2YL58_9AGAM|nr:hypothetical protein JVT61DRAFT_6838 [Boletus reticuloceps]
MRCETSPGCLGFLITWGPITYFLVPDWPFHPPIHEISSPASLNTSAAIVYNYVADGAKANAEAAGGERIIVSSGKSTSPSRFGFVSAWRNWRADIHTSHRAVDFIDAANDLRPPPNLKPTLPVGVRGAGKTVKHLTIYDTSKADRILGLKYRTIAETTKDTLADYEARG